MIILLQQGNLQMWRTLWTIIYQQYKVLSIQGNTENNPQQSPASGRQEKETTAEEQADLYYLTTVTIKS